MRVWLITEKCLRHSRHRYGIGRRYATSDTRPPPQCGQTGPLGQRRDTNLHLSRPVIGELRSKELRELLIPVRTISKRALLMSP